MAITLFSGCNSQVPDSNNGKKNSNNGKYIEVKEIRKDENGYATLSIDYNYDDRGILKKKIFNDLDLYDNLYCISLYFKIECDEQGKPIKETGYDYKNKESEVISKEYDESGYLNKFTSTDGQYNYTLTYENSLDESNRLKESTEYMDGDETCTIKYQYDDKGNIIEEDCYDKSGNLVSSIIHEWIPISEWNEYKKNLDAELENEKKYNSDLNNADITGTYWKLTDLSGAGLDSSDIEEILALRFTKGESITNRNETSYEIRDDQNGYVYYGPSGSEERYSIDIDRDAQTLRFIAIDGDVDYSFDFKYCEAFKCWYLEETFPFEGAIYIKDK